LHFRVTLAAFFSAVPTVAGPLEAVAEAGSASSAAIRTVTGRERRVDMPA
jgi:hypothetical protein